METSYKIIIANEDINEIQKAKTAFEKKGATIVGTAQDGISLESIINTTAADAVVLDVMLPGKDGFCVIENAIKNNIQTSFFVTTSLKSTPFIQKALNLGVKYYMLTPIDYSIVYDRITDSFAEIEESSTFQNKNRELEEKITNLFITVGIPAHIKGYQFLREAIKMAIKKPEVINSITKELYPSIASKFETSSSKVERAIRHAIEVAWNRGKIENINNVFGIHVYSSNDKPTNGEFIALVADKMLLEG